MPPRPSLLDVPRTFICNSCLSALRKRSNVTPWPIRQLSQSADAMAPTRKTRRTPEQEAERVKTLETLGLLNNTQTKPTVNYFEQGDNGKLRILENETEFSKALVDPGGELDARLKEFEEQLQSATSIARDIEKMGGKDEADRLRKQLSQDPADEEETVDGVRVSALAVPIQGLNGHAKDRFDRFNGYIRRIHHLVATKKPVLPVELNRMWKAYVGARINMPGRWHTIPAPTWQLLWKVFSAEYDFDANRMSHIYTLSKDMQNAGITLLPEQQLLALEAMFADGWETEAIENHRRHATTLGSNPETFERFWLLGLRMNCQVGNIERAERIANMMSESTHELDPRYLLPLIRSYAALPGKAEAGFKLYRALRDKLGDSMIIEDYDAIISFFLTSGQVEHALVIFVDMMKSGAVDLVGLDRYPSSVANPFFFGKWLKRLIGAGDLEGAFSVLRLMRAHKITPRPIQVNGLIGAWIRSGVADNFQKAEDVAWAMINARLQFRERRKRGQTLRENRIFLYQSGDGWPRASLETFSLLAENYRERGLMKKMTSLWNSFREASIAPDSFILNQVLLSYLQGGKPEIVIDIYHELFTGFKVKPDSFTFMALWQSLPANRLVQVPEHELDKEVERTRSLFAEMIKHASIFRSEDGEGLDKFLARNILHSFRKIQDYVGLLLALRAFRRLFNYNPPDMVVLELMLRSQDLERFAKRREGGKLIQAQKTLNHYLHHRFIELKQSGEIAEGEEVSPQIRAEETGNFLELQVEATFSEAAKGDAQRLAVEAAEQMGLAKNPDQEA